jgi:hypothetical protein
MSFVNPRSQDDFRVNFLKKLSYQGVWVPQAKRPPQHQTLIIFDWDDTLLCTTYLNVRQTDPAKIGEPLRKHLNAIERTAVRGLLHFK